MAGAGHDAGMDCFRARAVTIALALTGCGSAAITAPHQPYTAMLDHAGQLDISARGGVMATNLMTAAAQVAYAPIDNLEIAANVDVDGADEDTHTLHVGGGAAIGAFARNDVFRAELLVGGNGGASQGSTFCPDGARCTSTFRPSTLSGPYGQAFVQGAIGFEIPYFELAGGLRFFTHSVLAHALGSGIDTTTWYTRGFVDPYLMIRVPIDWFRIELLAGWPIALGGDAGPTTGPSASFESTWYPYVTLGIGVQLDTMTSPIVGLDHALAPATQ